MRRVQDFLASHRFLQIGATVLLLALIAFMYFRMKKAQTDLEEYLQAKSCPIRVNCREKIEAVVLDSESKLFVFRVISKSGNTSINKNARYFVTVSSDIGERRVELTPDSPSNKTQFDIPNIHIPSGENSLFAEGNFYKNQIVFIEVWKEQVTLLYADEIVDVPDAILQPAFNPDVQPAFVDNPSPRTYKIALPTTIHPIFRQAGTERDFIGVCFIGLLLLFVLYSGELNRIPMKNNKSQKSKDNDD